MENWISCSLILMIGVLTSYAEKHEGLMSTCSDASVTEGETGQLIYTINSAIIAEADPQTFIYIKKYQQAGNILQCRQASHSSDVKCNVIGDHFHWEGIFVDHQIVLKISNAALDMQGRYDLHVVFKSTFQNTTSCDLTVNRKKGVKPDTEEPARIYIIASAAVTVFAVAFVAVICILRKRGCADRLASFINLCLHKAKSGYNGNNSPKDDTFVRNNSFPTKTDTNTLENNRDKAISPPRVEELLTAVQDEKKNDDTAHAIKVEENENSTTDERTHTKESPVPSQGLLASALQTIVNMISLHTSWTSERKASRTAKEEHGHFAEEAVISCVDETPVIANQDREVESGAGTTEKDAFLPTDQTPSPTGSEKGHVQLKRVAFVHDDFEKKGSEKEDSLQKADGTGNAWCSRTISLLDSPGDGASDTTPIISSKLQRFSEKQIHYSAGAPGKPSSFHSLQNDQKLPHTPSNADEINRRASTFKKQSDSVREREPVSLRTSVPQQPSQKSTYQNWTPHSAGGSGKTPSLHSLQNHQKLPHTPSNADEINRRAPTFKKQNDSVREREPVSLRRSVPQQPSQKSTYQSRRPHRASASGKTPSPNSLQRLQPAVGVPMVFPMSNV
ncbi:uncharacterized protein [Littorina saxatilis]|uniref:uncharacterized protein isoform X2 n=1 Tax=Littorina saxatilis TaxID=31220 RepID=UPI0038B4B8B7